MWCSLTGELRLTIDQELDTLNGVSRGYTLVMSELGFEQFDSDFPMLLAKHAPGAEVMALTYLPVPLLRMPYLILLTSHTRVRFPADVMTYIPVAYRRHVKHGICP